MSEDPTGPGPVSPLSVGGIRRGICSLISFGVLAFAFVHKLKTDPKSVTSVDIEVLVENTALAFATLTSLYVGVMNIWKRIRVGQDPTNTAPPVKVPDIVNTVVSRLSR